MCDTETQKGADTVGEMALIHLFNTGAAMSLQFVKKKKKKKKSARRNKVRSARITKHGRPALFVLCRERNSPGPVALWIWSEKFLSSAIREEPSWE